MAILQLYTAEIHKHSNRMLFRERMKPVEPQSLAKSSSGIRIHPAVRATVCLKSKEFVQDSHVEYNNRICLRWKTSGRVLVEKIATQKGR